MKDVLLPALKWAAIAAVAAVIISLMADSQNEPGDPSALPVLLVVLPSLAFIGHLCYQACCAYGIAVFTTYMDGEKAKADTREQERARKVQERERAKIVKEHERKNAKFHANQRKAHDRAVAQRLKAARAAAKKTRRHTTT